MKNDPSNEAAAVALFVGVLDINREEAVAFAAAGHTTVEEIAFVPLGELLEVAGLDPKRIIEVRGRAIKCMAPGQAR